MAKSDFCFTYYDGDASRDMAHMNRLERGCYTDIIISQRKFGHLTLDQIKKILGKDFVECWPAIELIMKVDQDGKVFIEWLQNSETKSKKHSKRQSENAAKRVPLNSQSDAIHQPKSNLAVPLEDVYGNEDVVENKKESISGPRGPANFQESFEWAFDDLTLEQFAMHFKGIDIPEQLKRFRLKCDNDPAGYHSRDPAGLRAAFQYQLEHAKPKTNGRTHNDKKQQHTQSLVDGIVARHGLASQGE